MFAQHLFFMFLSLVFIKEIEVVYSEMKLPDSMPLCKRSDKNLNECLKDAIQKSYPVLAKGLPEFNLPSLDPLHLHEINLNQEDGGTVHVKLRLTHSDLQGLSKLEVTSVDADWDNYRIKINVKVNTITMEGDYEVQGKIMVLPINGSGRYNFMFEGGDAHVELLGKGVIRNDVTYMDVQDISWDYNTNHMTILMENLFNGDKGRSDNMNAFLNDHWREMSEELKETMQMAFVESFKEFTKYIFDNIPINNIAIP